MRSHAKASSAGSNSGRGVSRRQCLLALVLCLCAAACLIPGSALAGETRLPVESFGSDGTSGGTAFESPGALAFDQGNEHLYAYDVFPHTVYGFDASTPATHTPLGANFPLLVSEGGSLADLAADPSSHNLYYAAAESFAIDAFDATGTAVGGNFPLSGELPCGAAVDPSGNVWIGELFEGGVSEYDSAGNSIGFVSTGEQGSACHVALDSDANLYASIFEGGVWKYTAASGYTSASKVDSQSREFSVNPIVVDRSSDDLYVVHPNRVSVYDSSGAPLYEFGSTVAGAEFNGIAIDEVGERVYLSDAAHGKLQVFGPPVPLPSVTTENPSALGDTFATLNGTVNPEGKALTDCHFEYVTEAAFKSTGFSDLSSGGSASCEPSAASIPPDSTDHSVKADVSGLNGNTAYRFRLVAGSAEGTADGNDRALTTASGPPAISAQKAEAVGNTDVILSAKVNPKGAPTTYHVEYGTSASYGQSSAESSPIGFSGENSNHSVSVHIGGLTPGAAYHFRFVATSLAGKAEGDDTTFTTFTTFPPSPPTSGACPNDQFRTGFGGRLSDCRAYEQASPVDKHGANVQGKPGAVQVSSNGDRVTFYLTGGLPTTGGSTTLSAYLASRGAGGWSTDGLLPLLEPKQIASIVGWSDDLSTTFAESRGELGGANLFLRDSATGAYDLFGSFPSGPGAGLGGYAEDTSHLTFEGNALLPGAAAGQANLYELNHGTLSLPGRIPVAPARSCDDEAAPACVFAPQGAFAGNRGLVGGGNGTHNSISRDGSKVFFTDRASKQLYVREDGVRTVQISASQKTNGTGPGGSDPLGPKPVVFREATPNGTHVFFTSPEELTDDAVTGVGPAIARANLDGSGANHTFLPLPSSADGVAVDGSHIYWVNTNAGTIARANLDGTGVNESFIGGASKPQYVAVDGAHIYWTNAANGANGEGTIGRANLDGTGVEQSFITGASNPQGIALDASFVYWANAGSTEATRAIGRANLDGTSPEQSFVTVTEGTKGPVGVAVSSSFIYWTNAGNDGQFSEFSGKIGRATIAGASPNQEFVEFLNAPRGLAIDGSYLYWTNNNENSSIGPAIGRVKLDGSERNRAFIHTAAAMRGLAIDGSHLYWSAGEARDTGNDLYRYDSASDEFTDLSADSNPEDLKGADVQGFLGASSDGSYAYFAANGILAPGASAGGVRGDDGTFSTTPSNLYVTHAGTVKFIAPLDIRIGGRDAVNFGSGVAKTSRVADDGTLVFSSEEIVDLSGHDHGNICGDAGPCTEFYRYTPVDEGLTCITCNPTGPPSATVELLSGGIVGLSSGAGEFLGSPPNATILTRNLSADGDRFFFEATEALLPADTNGVGDVYEWEAKGSGSCESESQSGGCLYLISSGTSPEASHFLDASSDGDHAFFFTHQQLVPGDGDELTDVYDAGVGAGLASQHTLAPPTCASTACQANPAPPPDPSLSSATFSGAGNLRKSPSARKCPKGKRKVRRAGKVHCQKASKAKQHKRHNNRGGSK